MSAIRGIDFTFSTSYSVTEVVNNFLENGWSCFLNHEMHYLDVGDKDRYEWISATRDQWGSVWNVIKEKERLAERVGISIFWEGSSYGGQLLFFAEGKTLVFVMSPDRKLDKKGETDFEWYVRKIAKPIEKSNITVIDTSIEEIET